ncbi:MAG: response regulator [Alphaproteobacteria bacterium]
MEIVFGEPERNLRTAFRAALHRVGFSNVVDYEKFNAVRQHIERRQPDLLVLDAQLGGENVPELVSKIRQGKLGINPFIPVILTLWEPKQETVKACAGSGADDLLVKPISPGQLVDRMVALVENRKPFVVTSDYIGPDRRKDANRSSDIPLIDVPNTFQKKIKGEKIDQTSLNAMIASVQEDINDQRLKRNAFQLAFLVELVLPLLVEGKTDSADLKSNMDRMAAVARDTGIRMEGSEYDHVNNLCASMLEVAERLAGDLNNPSKKDIDLLKPLSDAILLGFNPESDAAQMAGQITDAVSTYSAKQKKS